MSSLDNDESLPPINVSVAKRRRNLPGRPDPDAEVIALSPRSLLTTNRFVCEICGKGFQRDQNLQLHRRGHNLPWRLKQKESHEYRKKVYICPELNCVHHNPARALGDLTGIKKHFSRKHGEKKWKCDKCSKRYAVQSDWKAHQKTCGTKEYRCDCGYLFSRKDSFITHRAFCDVLENKKDSPCNDEQGKQLVASLDKVADENTVESDMPAPMDLAASPASPGSGGEGPTCSEFLKSSPNERGSDHAIPESGVAVLSPPKWLEGGVRADNCGSKQKPELSLHLGTDFGPGPPNEAHVLCTQNAPGPILGFPSPRCPSKLEFSPLASSATQMTSKHAPSVGAMGMLASLFTSSAHRQSGADSIDSVSHAFLNSDHDHLSLSAGLSSSAHGLRTACGPSKAYLHTSSAATSATALLQKAAELGSKASNPLMFQWCGVGGRDSKWSTNSQGLPGESPWPGFHESHLTSMELKARRPEEYTISAEFLGSQSLSRKGNGVHAMGPSDGACLPGNTLLNACFQGKVGDGHQAVLKRGHRNEEGTSSAMPGDSSCALRVGCAQQHKGGGSQIGEGEKRMVDFLGVNSIGTAMDRSRGSAGMGQTLPHRDLARGASLTSEMRVPKRFHYPNSSAG